MGKMEQPNSEGAPDQPEGSDLHQVGPMYENTHYEINPELRLVKKNANVSYRMGKEYIPRRVNIFEDSNTNTWYEIKKNPKTQMTISLLAQPFFNVATVIEVPKNGIIGKILAKTNLGLYSHLKPFVDRPKFLSKSFKPGKIVPKNKTEAVAEVTLYKWLFDDHDKTIKHNQNIENRPDSYYMYDFEDASVKPIEDQKIREGKYNNPVSLNAISLDLYGDHIVYAEREDIEKKTFVAVNKIADKLVEVTQFYTSTEGEDFFKAVLTKTDYLGEVVKSSKKDKEFKESLYTPENMYKGFLDRIMVIAQTMLEQVRKMYENNTYTDRALYEKVQTDLASVIDKIKQSEK